MTGTTRPLPLMAALLAVAVLCCISGTAAGYQVSESTFQRVAADYTDHLIEGYGNVPVYHPDSTVATTGVIESLPDEKALWDWRYGMHQIITDTRADMQPYFFPHGPVISCGYDLLGTICVGIWEEADTDKQTRDEIYAVIDAAAQQRGIADVPVIFIREPIADTRPLPWTDPNGMPLIKRLRGIADGYPDVTGAAAGRQTSGAVQANRERSETPGILPAGHCSVSSLITCLSA